MYRPTIAPRATAFAAVVAGALGAALLLAFFWGQLGNVGRIAFLETVVPAFVIAKLVAWLCKRLRFAWPKTAAAISILATALAITGALYDAHRTERNKAIAEQREFLSVSADSAAMNSFFEEEIADLNFYQFLRDYFGMDGQAEDGSATLFGTRMGLTVFAFELLAAFFVAGYEPSGVASEPTCSRCGDWLAQGREHAAIYGIANDFTKALRGGRLDDAIEKLGLPDTKEKTGLALALCPRHPSVPAVLRISEYYLDSTSRALGSRHCADLSLSDLEQQRLTPIVEALPNLSAPEEYSLG